MNPQRAHQTARRLSTVSGGTWSWKGSEAERVAAAWALEHGEAADCGGKPCPKGRGGRHWWIRDAEVDGQRCDRCGALR